MTTNYHTVVRIPAISGIPSDAVENTFSWIMPGALLLTDITEIHSALAEFYNTTPVGGTNPVAGYIGETATRSASTMTTYAIPSTPGPLGPPVDISTFFLAAHVASTMDLPSEVACALSFHGDYAGLAEFGSGSRPRARVRGRIYLGPLVNVTTTSVQVDAVTGRVKPSLTMRNDITAAAARLRDRAASQWAVWSRKNNALYPVVNGWVDDAFDIQRRRGEKALSRTAF